MSEAIELTGITEYGCHGVYPEEKLNKQLFVVDLQLQLLSLTRNDFIENTVDYAQLVDSVRSLISDQKFDLIETLAESIADHCLANKLVANVVVKLHKPAAAKSLGIDDVSVVVKK